MTISAVSNARVSMNMQFSFSTDALRRTQLDMLLTQNRIATGRRFVSASEDPVAAGRAVRLRGVLEQQQQFQRNIDSGKAVLEATDVAIAEINDLLNEASTIASQNVSNLTSAAEREAQAELITSIRARLQSIGNRQLNGRYIFAGQDILDPPFVDALGGVAYLGDRGDLIVRTDRGQFESINVTGDALFGALSARIKSDVDLTPIVAATSRLDEMNGLNAELIRAGSLVINEPSGVGAIVVSLNLADTLGDVATLISAAATCAGSSLSATVSGSGLVLTPGAAAVTVGDTGGGQIASALGILTAQATTTPIVGDAITPRLTRLTPVADLAGGAGIDLTSGLIITNGPQSETIDLSGAQTVQDIINRINGAGLYVLARISEDGSGIDVFNQVSGVSLSIGENGGTTAADLGLATMSVATPIAQLNFGLGVTTMEGQDDLRITATDESTVDVNLDGAETIGDVIDLINTAAADAGVSITAAFATVGLGIRITDGTAGAMQLGIASLNLSSAAGELGLAKTVDAGETELVGDDVNPTRSGGLLGALIDLEAALSGDDTRGIGLAAERLDELHMEVTRTYGVVGARAKAMIAKLGQMEDAARTTELFLSEVEDLDFTQAITELVKAQMQLQASLQVGAQVMRLSLMDFLR